MPPLDSIFLEKTLLPRFCSLRSGRFRSWVRKKSDVNTQEKESAECHLPFSQCHMIKLGKGSNNFDYFSVMDPLITDLRSSISKDKKVMRLLEFLPRAKTPWNTFKGTIGEKKTPFVIVNKSIHLKVDESRF